MREIGSAPYNREVYTDENMLLNFKLIDPVLLDRNVTFLYGMNNNEFPLLSVLQGNANSVESVKPVQLNDTQYKWNVAGRTTRTSMIRGASDNSITKQGLGHRPFTVIMSDNKFIAQYTCTSPDGKSICRIQSEGKPIAPDQYEYVLQLVTGSATDFVAATNFVEGSYWIVGAPIVAATKSDGNRSYDDGFSQMTNQFGFHRFSKQITGNVANKVVNIELPMDGNTTTNLWMPYAMKQWELDRRRQKEDFLWRSPYNRDAKGVIHLKDPDTGEPIPTGAGVIEQVKASGMYESYGTKLTLRKLDNTLLSLHSNRNDNSGTKEIICHTGSGGARMFHNAVMNDAKLNSYFQVLGDMNIKEGNDGLTYGAYFKRYKTIDDLYITIKVNDFFNKGHLAELDRANGRMYEGLPAYSYTLAFLDHSITSGGDRNIKFVSEAGREMLKGVYSGLTNLPGEWAAGEATSSAVKKLATKKDEASYEVFESMGVAIKNTTTSFILEMEF